MRRDDRAAACLHAAALLRAGAAGEGGLVAGFDGFVDRIVHVVDERLGPGEYRRLATLSAMAGRVAAAAGKSANLELVVQRTALGGNGAILARAAGALGARTLFVGTVGEGRVDPLFAPLTEGGNRAATLGAAGKTEALEFEDGKLMLGEPATLGAVTWESVVGAAGGVEALRAELSGGVLAMGNWTMTAGMTGIWERLAGEVLPGSGCAGVFVDLADPAKRSDADLTAALGAMRVMNAHAPVTLGLNAAEAERVWRVLGGRERAAEEHQGELAEAVRGASGLAGIALHTRHGAALAEASGVFAMDGPFVRRPLATTGAGDHFNAGVCVGALLGGDRASRVALGVGCSGLFVRTGRSPVGEELAAFLEGMPEAEAA